MKRYFFLTAFFLVFAPKIYGQTDSILYINEISISDLYLKNNQSQNIQHFPDSIVKINQATLTDLLRNHTLIHFKENGNGMVASPTFRGTTAQQTAVTWNGININSQLNGQTDFNTISSFGYDEIDVKSGGGSAIYGSSAIGGTIHLQNNFKFQENFSNEVLIKYGSFNTQNWLYKVNWSTQKFHLQSSFNRFSSANDYPIIGQNRKNKNGQFKQNNYQLNFAYKLNNHHQFKFYSEIFDSERHFSVIFVNENKTKYDDVNTRFLGEWSFEKNYFHSRLKAGFISESYRYFGNIATDYFTQNKVQTYFAKWEFDYKINSVMRFSTILDATQNAGNGSDIIPSNRQNLGFASLFTHQINSKIHYDLSIRKDFSSVYKNPILYSLGSKIDFLSWYQMRLHISKNFRVPTFNDLYWNPGGNTSIIPETSHQAEVSHDFAYAKWKLSFTTFYNKIDDLILWKPSASNWAAINVEDVISYGFESSIKYATNLKGVNVGIEAQFSYTNSEDQLSKKQLIYTPKTKALLEISLGYKAFLVQINGRYIDEVYTRTDNNSRYNLPSYQLFDCSMTYKIPSVKSLSIGGNVSNIFNKKYASMEDRWMPGINYQMFINFKF